MLGNRSTDKIVEEAILFLADSYRSGSGTTKPAVLHSIRVGNMLDAMEKPTTIIVAGILHDILEDTSVTDKQLEAKFGKEISDLVVSMTFDRTIINQTEQYKDAFYRELKAGKDVLEIRAVDLYVNSFYYKYAEPTEELEYLIEKFRYFLSISQGIIDKRVYVQLRQRLKELTDTRL